MMFKSIIHGEQIKHQCSHALLLNNVNIAGEHDRCPAGKIEKRSFGFNFDLRNVVNGMTMSTDHKNLEVVSPVTVASKSTLTNILFVTVNVVTVKYRRLFTKNMLFIKI